jgi:hypothetical protein
VVTSNLVADTSMSEYLYCMHTVYGPILQGSGRNVATNIFVKISGLPFGRTEKTCVVTSMVPQTKENPDA